jgi:hypothetical protein
MLGSGAQNLRVTFLNANSLYMVKRCFVPIIMRYTARMVLGMLRTMSTGSNCAQGMDVGLIRVVELRCFVHYSGLGRGQSPVQESYGLNYCFSINSDSEPEKKPILLNTQRKKKKNVSLIHPCKPNKDQLQSLIYSL